MRDCFVSPGPDRRLLIHERLVANNGSPVFFLFFSFLHSSFQQRHSRSVIGSSNFMELHGSSSVCGFSSLLFFLLPKMIFQGKVWPIYNNSDRSIFALNSVAVVTVSTPVIYNACIDVIAIESKRRKVSVRVHERTFKGRKKKLYIIFENGAMNRCETIRRNRPPRPFSQISLFLNQGKRGRFLKNEI